MASARNDSRCACRRNVASTMAMRPAPTMSRASARRAVVGRFGRRREYKPSATSASNRSSAASPRIRLRSTSLRTRTAPIVLQQRLRHRRLAAARESAGDDQRRARRLRVAPGERAGSRATRRAPRPSRRPPRAAPRAAARSWRGPARGRRDRTAAPRAPRSRRSFEIRVEKAVREIGATAVLQVHHREGDLAHHVDPAHRLVELDAVEDDELAVDRARCCRDAGRRGTRARSLARGGAGKRRAARRARARSRRGGDSMLGRAPHPWPRAERSRRSCAARDRRISSGAPNAPSGAATAIAPWNAGDLRREPVDVGGPELAALEQPARQRAPARNSRIFTAYSSAGPSPPRTGASMLPVIGTTLEVERRREPPIEPQLLFAEESPRRERREIEEAEIDRLLDLVRVRPRSAARTKCASPASSAGAAAAVGCARARHERGDARRASIGHSGYSALSSSRLSEIRSRSFTTRPWT